MRGNSVLSSTHSMGRHLAILAEIFCSDQLLRHSLSSLKNKPTKKVKNVHKTTTAILKHNEAHTFFLSVVRTVALSWSCNERRTPLIM